MATVGESDDHRLRKGAALFQVEADLNEGLKRNAAYSEVTDADGLDLHRDRLLLALGRIHHAARVVLRQARQLLDRVLVLHRQHRLRLGHLLVGRTAILERDLALAHAEQRIGLMLFDFPVSEPRRVRRLLRDDPDLLKRLAGRSRGTKGDVVDVAGGAVRHHGDKILVATHPRWHQPCKLAEVIRRHLALRRTADVVQRVVGKEGDLFPLQILHGEDRDVRVRRTSGAVEYIGAGAGIHLHRVEPTEGVQRHLAGFQIPAPVEDLVRQRMGRSADRGGFQSRMRLRDRSRHAFDELLVVGRRALAARVQ